MNAALVCWNKPQMVQVNMSDITWEVKLNIWIT